MKKLIITIVTALTLLTLPLAAQAHTGSVICDSRGVVFTYNPNFEQNTFVTETVGGAQRIETVFRHEGKVDIWANITGTIVAGATWNGGSIKTVTLVCPAAPPPPPAVTPPPPPPVAPPAPPPAPPVAPPAPPAPATQVTPPKKAPPCPPGTTRTVKGHKKPPYNAKLGVLTCYKVIHVPRFIERAPKHKVKGVQKRTSGGVAG